MQIYPIINVDVIEIDFIMWFTMQPYPTTNYGCGRQQCKKFANIRIILHKCKSVFYDEFFFFSHHFFRLKNQIRILEQSSFLGQ